MWNLICKITALIGVMVFIIFMINHGNMDFTLLDTITAKVKYWLSTKESQDILKEISVIFYDTVKMILTTVKNIISQIAATQ